MVPQSGVEMWSQANLHPPQEASLSPLPSLPGSPQSLQGWTGLCFPSAVWGGTGCCKGGVPGHREAREKAEGEPSCCSQGLRVVVDPCTGSSLGFSLSTLRFAVRLSKQAAALAVANAFCKQLDIVDLAHHHLWLFHLNKKSGPCNLICLSPDAWL